MEKQELNSKQLWTNPVQCLNLGDNLDIPQTHWPHGVSEWKGCSLGINNQMRGKQVRHSRVIDFFFFKLLWLEKDGLIEPREPQAPGNSSLEGDKNKIMVVCPCPFLSLYFNFLRLIWSPHFERAVLPNVRASLGAFTSWRAVHSKLIGRREAQCYCFPVFRGLRKWFERNKVRKPPSDVDSSLLLQFSGVSARIYSGVVM